MTAVFKSDEKRENTLGRHYETEAEKVFYESFLQDALDAWEEKKKDGLHLTLDEVCQWLNTWGTEKEGSMPECHK